MTPVAGLILIWLTTTNAHFNQASSPSIQAVTPEKPTKPIVLVGCVAADDANADQFTLSDPTAGVTYRLSGTKLQTYKGRRVRIVGGLYPTANVAAQAGGIDPTKAAIAATTATETGPVELPKFQVTQVRQLKGACAPSTSK